MIHRAHAFRRARLHDRLQLLELALSNQVRDSRGIDEDLQGGKVEVSGGDLLDQSLSAVYGKSTDAGSFMVSGRLQRGQLPVGFWFEDNDSENTQLQVKLVREPRKTRRRRRGRRPKVPKLGDLK